MGKLDYERKEKDDKIIPQLNDSEFLLIKAIENLTEAIIVLGSKVK